MTWIPSQEWVAYGEPKDVHAQNMQRNTAANERMARKYGLRTSRTGGITYYHCPQCKAGWIFARDAVGCHSKEPCETADTVMTYDSDIVECCGEEKPDALYITLRRAGEYLGIDATSHGGRKKVWEFATDHGVSRVAFRGNPKDGSKRGYDRVSFLAAQKKVHQMKKSLCEPSF